MKEFKYKVKQVEQTLYLVFEGLIDEDAKLPPVDLAKVKKIVLDLNDVCGINSTGIREWLDWIRRLEGEVELTLEHCPKSIVLQFNMVAGFIPPKARITSFYLPYYCDKCDYEGSHLVTVGREVFRGPKEATVQFDAQAAIGCEETDCEIALTSAGKRILEQISKSIEDQVSDQVNDHVGDKK